MTDCKTIAESNNFIVLDKYTKIDQQGAGYQTEADLEREFIADLADQGYEPLPQLTTSKAMIENVRVQLQMLNKMEFSDDEWRRFCEEYLDRPGDIHIDKTRKIHNDHIYELISCRLFLNLNKQEAMPTDMM